MKEKLRWALVIVVSMVLGGSVVIGADEVRGHDSSGTTVIERQVQPAGGVSTSTTVKSLQDVSQLYSKVHNSVVQINAASSRPGNNSGSLGSGIVLDKDGHILTNNHVINGFDQIDVTLADGTAASAKVVGIDAGNDFAVLQVNLPKEKLQPANLGDSSKVQAGEAVIAVGNPFGIEGSVTQGIVSGIGRTLAGGAGRPLRQLIQSDAAINPGNSGGGLFDADGNVIGVTTAIENPSGDRVFVGIGYAVPIDTVKRFLPDLLAGKNVEHPRLGVSLQNMTPALAKTLNLSTEQGVLITQVDPSSAAAKAGLKGGTGQRGTVGDIVTSIDGKSVKNYDDLATYIDNKKVGDKITVKGVRDGKDFSADITLDAWKASNADAG